MFPLKITSHLSLDFFVPEDATFLFQLIDKNRAYLKEFLPWLDFCNVEQDSLHFIHRVNQENQDNTALTLAIKDKGTIVGVICFHAFDHANKSAGVGYWLSQDHQGRGIITQACKHLIDYGFNTLHLNEIKISCNTNNQKSVAIPQKLGFTRTQFLAQKEWLYDHFVDHLCFEITKEEWNQIYHDHQCRANP